MWRTYGYSTSNIEKGSANVVAQVTAKTVIMMWIALISVFIGSALGLWIAVMRGWSESPSDAPEILRNPVTSIWLNCMAIGAILLGLILGFVAGLWSGIGASAFAAVLWVAGSEIAPIWIRSMRRKANKLLGREAYPENEIPDFDRQ